jgi:ribonuclease P/MRP protein subunit RPP1
MGFYDLEIHSTVSIGENIVEEMAHMAKRLGLNGIGIVSYFPDIIEIPKLEEIDIVSCVMLKPSSAGELNQLARKSRKKAEVLLVHGGEYEINRAACENPLIDVLCHPELGRKDSGLDHICMKAAHDNNVAVQINFREILESYKRNRIYVFSSIKKNIKLCQKYAVPIVTCSSAVTKWGMRSGRELAAIAYLMGLDLGKAIETASTLPETIVSKNRDRLSGKIWEGIELED